MSLLPAAPCAPAIQRNECVLTDAQSQRFTRDLAISSSNTAKVRLIAAALESDRRQRIRLSFAAP
jgi:hypothetical protein